MRTKLNLRIQQVKCVDETGGGIVERFGNDEIYLEGFSIDAKARTAKVNPFSVMPALMTVTAKDTIWR